MKKTRLLFILLFFSSLSSIYSFPFFLNQGSIKIDKINQNIQKGVEFFKNAEFERAIELLEKSIRVSKNIKYQKGIGEANLHLGELYLISDPKKAKIHSSKSLEIALASNDNKLKIRSYLVLGNYFKICGNLEKSLNLYLKGYKIATSIRDKTYENLLSIFMQEIEALKGKHNVAVKKLLEIRKQGQKENNKKIVKYSSFILGRVYKDINKNMDALRALNNSLVMCHIQKDRVLSYEINFLFGQIFINTDRWKEAVENLKQNLEHYKKIHARYKEGLCYFYLGSANYYLKNLTRSKKHLSKAQDILKNFDYFPSIEIIYVELPKILINLSELTIAKNILSEGLNLFESKKFSQLQAFYYKTLAKLNFRLAKFSKGKKYLDFALEAVKKVRNLSKKSIFFKELGELFDYMGKDSISLQYFLEAKKFAEEIDDKETLGLIYPNLAQTYFILGDQFKSYNYVNETIQILPNIYPKEKHVELVILVGHLILREGKESLALQMYKAAYKMSKTFSRIVKNNYLESFCLNTLGLYNLYKKNYDKAIGYLNRSLNILNEQPHIGLEANVYEKLAQVYYQLNILQTAKSYIKTAIKKNEIVKNKRKLCFDYQLLANIYKNQGEKEKALFCLRKAKEYKDKIIEGVKNIYYLPSIVESFSTINEELLSLLYQLNEEQNNKKFIKEAFICSEKAKCRAMLRRTDNVRENIRSHIPNELVKKRNKLFKKVRYLGNQYSSLYFKNNKVELINEIREKIIDLEAELKKIDRRITELSPRYSSISNPEIFSIEQVQDYILKEKDCALVEYYLGSLNTYIFVITPDKFNLVRIEKGRDMIKKNIIKVRGKISEVKDLPSFITTSRKENLALLHNLYKDLILPITSYLEGINEIIIIPHGCLNYLPFEMLISEIENKNFNKKVFLSQYEKPTYLINDFSISYASSASMLNPAIFDKSKRKNAKRDILAVVNPKFGAVSQDTASESRKDRKNKFISLEYSEKEADMIEECFDNPKIFKRKQASKQNFIKECGDFPIIHLSTHGELNESMPSYSSLAFAFNQDKNGPDLLHAYEIFNLNINCDLVTLSACESGLGQEIEKVGGEGIFGLSRSFFYAGAKSLIVSLWKVSDESTSILMSEFYKNWRKEKTSKIEALREAKLYLMKKKKKIGDKYLSFSHPFFWAPFILIGQLN